MALLTPSKLLKLAIGCSVVLFIYVHVLMKYANPSEEPVAKVMYTDDIKSPTGEAAMMSRSAVDDIKTKLETNGSKKPTKASSKENTDTSEAKRDAAFNESLSFIIKDLNTRQHIRNEERYPRNENGTYKHMLVVQVHDRDHYLEALIQSLRSVRDISSSLLIVSHDFYSKQMFDLVERINFMPIFYPMAMQLYKDRFPGPDPEDCPRDIKKPQAVKLGCVNAEHPDLYGHYREAKYSQTKLHWFWKLHFVFDELAVTRKYTDYVTLIEEDHYMTPDSLYMLGKMKESVPVLCPKCRILTLGNYDKKPNYLWSTEVVAAPDFVSSKHNMAMSFNRSTYDLIKQYSKNFCDYDDYNWDWSMQYIGKNVIPGRLPTLIVKTPRVYHIGECGVHHKGKKCDPQVKINPILKLLADNESKLFPNSLKTGQSNINTYINTKKLKANGGWGDLRDHELCASFMDE